MSRIFYKTAGTQVTEDDATAAQKSFVGSDASDGVTFKYWTDTAGEDSGQINFPVTVNSNLTYYPVVEVTPPVIVSSDGGYMHNTVFTITDGYIYRATDSETMVGYTADFSEEKGTDSADYGEYSFSFKTSRFSETLIGFGTMSSTSDTVAKYTGYFGLIDLASISSTPVSFKAASPASGLGATALYMKIWMTGEGGGQRAYSVVLYDSSLNSLTASDLGSANGDNYKVKMFALYYNS